jgi:zinc protease
MKREEGGLKREIRNILSNIEGWGSVLFFIFLSCSSFSQNLPDKCEKYKLKNGLEIIFLEYGTLPVTSITLYVNTGRKSELPGMQAIAEITANSLLLGNKDYSRIEQDKLIGQTSSGIEARATDNFTVIQGMFSNNTIDEGVHLFSSIVLKPNFPKPEIDFMVGQMINYNKPSKMDIGALAQMYGRYAVYGTGNPLGRHFYPVQLGKINTDSINLFYKFNFTPKNSKLVISGMPDKEKVKQLIEQYFGSWEAAYGEVNGSSYDILPIKKKEYSFVNKPMASQAYLYWSKKAPDLTSKDVLAFDIACEIFSDILFEEIRAKEGKTYGIGVNYEPQQNNGVYNVGTQVRNEVMFATITSFDRELKKFFEGGTTQKRLDKAIKRMKGRILSTEDPLSMVSVFNPMVYPDFEKRKMVIAELGKIDLAALNKVIKKYFTPDSYKLVIAGSEKELNEQLNKIVGLQKLDLKVIEKDN